MVTREIQTFSDALLFELQRSKVKTLTFGQAWRCCQRAGQRLPLYFPEQATVGTTQFASDVLFSIGALESQHFIECARRGKRILSLSLSDEGKERLRSIVFTHQDRMG